MDKERNNKLIELMRLNEANHIKTREKLINLLDDKYKPEFMGMLIYKDGKKIKENCLL